MRPYDRVAPLLLAGSLIAFGSGALAQAPAQPPAQTSVAAEVDNAKIWIGRAQEFEEYLKTAKVVKMEDIPIGVTKPKRARLAPGGPVESMAWKTIAPGMHGGYWESYKSEIAGYELDKLLGLEMIPPTIERRVDGDMGAAIMWVKPIKSFKDLGGPPSPPGVHAARWNRQLIKAKMFDNLIFNKDPNLGNWLVDPAWNLILIDHTRSFTSGKDMAHKDMQRVDAELWDRMKGLTLESLTAVLKPWVNKGEIKSILERRDKMQEIIDKLVAKNGAGAVFVR